jgi:phosphate transport system substrate-binding protein
MEVRMTQHARGRTAIVAASLMTVALVGGSAAVSAQDTTWPEPATGVSGNVDIHGSSTVAPVSNAVGEAYGAPDGLNPDLGWSVGREGTGTGFDDYFCVDGADIADASRAIDEEEIANCTAAGVTFVELKIGYDGLAVITNVENEAVTCLNFADLYALMGPESNAIETWEAAGALAAELGSTTVFPTAPLIVSAPGDESGTYDSFIELALGDIIEERGQEETLRQPGTIYQANPNDNVLIEGIAGFPTSIGFVGLAYATENADRVKIVQVDGGDGCVTPDATTVSDGTYPISRPLFIYPATNRLATNTALQPFVDYYLGDEGIANVAGEGYVALPAEELAATRAAWLAATGR